MLPVYIAIGVVVVIGLILVGIYNGLVAKRQATNEAFAGIDVQLKLRRELIPNLVETVKGYAAQERETLTAVVEARAQVGQMKIPADILTNREAMDQFEKLQGSMTSALSRLLVVAERYPDLKSNQNFLSLQSQLEGTENRISVARRDYIESVRKYNTELRTIPGRWIAAIFYPDAKVKENLRATEGSATPPRVNFGK